MSVIVDPRLLPYYLTKEEAAHLLRRSPRTVQNYCDSGVLVRGKHWIKPKRGPRLFCRDGILAWLEADVTPERQLRTRARAAKLAVRSPELAALLEREAASGL